MRRRSILRSLVLLLGCPAALLAQADPTATAPTVLNPVTTVSGLNFELPQGTFRYGLTASEIFQFGYYGAGTIEDTNLSGNLAFSTKSAQHPFSAVYSGGVEIPNQGNYGTTFFQNLTLSQVYLTRSWNFNVGDTVSYLPQSPTTGLSGIPGTGDLGLDNIAAGTGPAQNVLSYNSNRVSNIASGSASRHLTGRTSLSLDGSYGLIHFFNGDLFNSRQIGADASISHQIDARTTAGIGVSYSIFQYDAAGNGSFQTRSLNFQGTRQISRTLSAGGSVGPQWINASESLGIPSRLTVAAGFNVTYTKRFGVAAVAYSRGTNGGSGVVPGAFSDNLSGSFSRPFGRNWSAALDAGFSRTTGLGNGSTPNLIALGIANQSSFRSTFGGAQANRRISGSISAFASYTASAQSYDNFASVGNPTRGALNGIVQSFAIGISYYPRSLLPGLF